MQDTNDFNRRRFLGGSLAALASTKMAAAATTRSCESPAETEKTPTDNSPSIRLGDMPCGKIKNVTLSRLILGGNLIGACAHSRDLKYVSMLMREYNTEDKILRTLELAERCGINTISQSPDRIGKYKRDRGGKMQTLMWLLPTEDETQMRNEIKYHVDRGVTMLYIQGENADRHVLNRRIDVLGKVVDMIKQEGIPAGIGAHSLQVLKACEKNKLDPDFYVKTFHMDRYWSATPKEKREDWCWYKPWGKSIDHDAFYDNMWCLDAEEVADFMQTVTKPWIAFKILAAGAIPPQMAFHHAFRKGADFILVGMFDFQIEQDAKLAISAVRACQSRKRPWQA
jgi:hypothetical protein